MAPRGGQLLRDRRRCPRAPAQLAIQSPDDQGRALRQGIIRHGNPLWIGANTALQTKLIAALHDSAIGGHSGIAATYQRVRKLFAWPGLKRAVKDSSASASSASAPSTNIATPRASCSLYPSQLSHGMI